MYYPRSEEGKIFAMTKWREALTLIGPRRVGKTTIAKKMLEMWIANGGQGEYFDLEMIGAPSNIYTLKKKIDALPKGSLVILDEIQNIKNWVKLVRDEIEYKKRQLIITGSSSSLLSKEIASSLAGRAVPENILPISYKDAKNWGIKSLEQYIETGGYPECVIRPQDAKRLHKLYLELTILRDVAARKGIREIKPLSDLAIIMLSENGKTISSKKTAQSVGISQPTFRSFVDGLNDAFLILSVPPYLHSPKERIISDSKHYAYDTGLQRSVSISIQEDFGRRYENLIAIELIRKGFSISYLKTDRGECDFIAQRIGTQNLAIQVWSGDEKIPEREITGLMIGMKVANAKGILLTRMDIQNKTKKIEMKKIEDWLLE
ncbi:MAG: ATP-binding protein [Candidatus Micrarchaeia archaeon]